MIHALSALQDSRLHWYWAALSVYQTQFVEAEGVVKVQTFTKDTKTNGLQQLDTYVSCELKILVQTVQEG